MDHYRRVCMQGAGGCVACYKSTFPIFNSDRGLFLFHCPLYKILELRDIGLLESLHKVGYCIMNDPLFLQDSDGGLPKVSDLNRSFRSDRKSTRLNSSHVAISYAVFCLKQKPSS